ncbi:MAG TPA: MBL fold metallo-hydrolase [Candidatus Saccharimonadales bacterium]|nr:MBL fold metallo-hydrolase [Candidatus Saccharimonadales bacterium]
MKLTKYDHACFTVEKDHQMLVVDPGNFSTDYLPSNNVVGIVITHEHADHYDPEQIAAIVDKNPEAVIIGHEDVISKVEVFKTQAVDAGDKLTIGLFELEFFGGTHAVIHRTMPVVANLGVMINDLLYYPGDSFTLPGRAIDTLAIPAGAPWLKIGDAMDFLELVKPRFAFPTHDAVLSDVGKGLADRLLGSVAEREGIEYRRLDTPVEL